MEEWRQIKDFPYEVSNEGNVRRLPGTSRKGSYNLSPGTEHAGHKCVYLSIDGKYTYKSVHRLVAETFIRPINDGEVVHHIDNNPANNFLSNLEIISHGSNCLRAAEEGCRQYKIGEVEVRQIKALLQEGKLTQDEIALRFNITRITVHRIKTGKRWAHIGD